MADIEKIFGAVRDDLLKTATIGTTIQFDEFWKVPVPIDFAVDGWSLYHVNGRSFATPGAGVLRLYSVAVSADDQIFVQEHESLRARSQMPMRVIARS